MSNWRVECLALYFDAWKQAAVFSLYYLFRAKALSFRDSELSLQSGQTFSSAPLTQKDELRVSRFFLPQFIAFALEYSELHAEVRLYTADRKFAPSELRRNHF